MKPQSIAFDYITEKVYLIDKTSGTLNVVDKSGKHHAMLISNLNNPHDLVLDPAEGLVFIVQYNQSVTSTIKLLILSIKYFYCIKNFLKFAILLILDNKS